MKLHERTCARVVDPRNRSAYGLLSRAGRLVRTSGSDCPARHRPARHRPARVPAARRVSMAGELALDQSHPSWTKDHFLNKCLSSYFGQAVHPSVFPIRRPTFPTIAARPPGAARVGSSAFPASAARWLHRRALVSPSVTSASRFSVLPVNNLPTPSRSRLAGPSRPSPLHPLAVLSPSRPDREAELPCSPPACPPLPAASPPRRGPLT
ncbi:unnamed protein product [Nesidiocoris tenuis]|uniref:Uncharacterized protein n=1 Tax=Nesidiocoris tenuis TaxID=355587 RepID=A0A6H5GZT6_9HEMI|nr:unnamed protein product [Nesidiocoris tenuis]